LHEIQNDHVEREPIPAGLRQNLDVRIPLMAARRPSAEGIPSIMDTFSSSPSTSNSFVRIVPPWMQQKNKARSAPKYTNRVLKRKRFEVLAPPELKVCLLSSN
jgi:hypothetical protein